MEPMSPSHRVCGSWLAVMVAMIVVVVSGVIAAPLSDDPDVWTRARVEATNPHWPNPFLAFLPVGARPDMAYWRARLAMEAIDRRARKEAVSIPAVVEAETAGTVGGNDHPLVGEPIGGVGTTPWTSADAVVTGWLRDTPVAGGFAVEPDDAIAMATPLEVLVGRRVAVDGVIGDGAHGSAGSQPSGDFDFFTVTVAAGQPIEIAVITPHPTADLDPVVGVYTTAGTLLGRNDNVPLSGFLENRDSWLKLAVPADGTYLVAVGGAAPAANSGLPADPFDPGSGPGARSEGAYHLVIGVATPEPGDRDCYQLDVRPGDVVGATVFGAAGVAIVDLTDAELVATSGGDLSALYPLSSSLPGGGDGTVARVLDAGGGVAVCVSQPIFYELGDYRLELRIDRSALDLEPALRRQLLFVDFDGATVDATAFGGVASAATLSPLADFLAGWDLGPDDEGPLADAILAAVRDNLAHDVRSRGSNGDASSSGLPAEFEIEIWSSRDHADPGPAPDVARVVVGGSIAELGVPTVGIAEHVDPGNLDTGGTAIVLLDLLSAPASDPTSLNGVDRAPGFPLRDLVALAIGNIVSHEAGHLFGNYHTWRDVGLPTIMDSGGDLHNVLGVGDDEVAGTSDDLDVDLGPDEYAPGEIFSGIENTLEVVSFGLPLGGLRPRVAFGPSELVLGPAAVGTVVVEQLRVGSVGTAALAVSAPTVAGPDAARFTAAAPGLPAILDSGTGAEIEVSFVADALGHASAELTMTDDDPGSPQIRVPLDGRSGLPAATINPTTHNFGTIVYGDPSSFIAVDVTVTNQGIGPLTVAHAVLSGGTPNRFAVDAGGSPFEVPPGGSHVLEVAFRPAGEVGVSRTVLAVLGDDPALPRLDVVLSGFADGPDLAVSPGLSYAFGAITLGESRYRDFRISNVGTRNLVVAATEICGDDDNVFEIVAGGDPFEVAPGAEHPVRVTATPTAEGRFEAELHLASNDPDRPDTVVEMVVEGVTPSMVVQPPTYDFGPVRIGAAASRGFTLANEGEGRLRVDAPTVAGDDAVAFEITAGGGSPIVLPRGARFPFTVEFRPGAVGVLSAVVAFDGNDPATPHLEVELWGTGALPELSLDKRCRSAGYPECTVTVANLSGVAAPEVVVEDQLPAQLEWHSDDCGVGEPVGSTWTWTITSLEPGESRACTLSFEPAANVSEPVVNTATVRWSGTPAGQVEDEATALVPLTAPIPALSALGAALLTILLALAACWILRR